MNEKREKKFEISEMGKILATITIQIEQWMEHEDIAELVDEELELWADKNGKQVTDLVCHWTK